MNASICDIAKGYKIPVDHLRWYAAFHEKEKQVHIHMVVFSSDPKEGYLTKQGIREIKSAFAKQIYRQDMISVYERQTEYRNTLQRDAESVMVELIDKIEHGGIHSEKLERLTAELAERLKSTSGKKVYGYLPPTLKRIVDEIVDGLAKDERVSAAYALWQEMRDEVCRTYSENLPERLPLSRQKEFKPVRNMVIREALKLSEMPFTFEDEGIAAAEQDALPDGAEPIAAHPTEGNPSPDEADVHFCMAWSDSYREARTYLFGSEETPQDFMRAFELFKTEAQRGNALAMYDLGRMHADGLGGEADMEAAQRWYAKALDAFLAVEDEKANRYAEYRIGKLYAAGCGTEQDYTEAANWFGISSEQNYMYAQYSLAGLYRQGKGVAQDDAKAHGLYLRSASQGFPYAAFELGKMFRDGTGCAVDAVNAAEYFRQAFAGFRSLEKQSHDDKLQYRIGWMHLHGVGTEKDEALAREWFEKASRLGNAHAQYQLAKLILGATTQAEPEQVALAMAWLHKAAEAGQDCAQYALGKLYSQGNAVEKDIPKALAFFTQAAKQGNDYAAYALGKLLLERGDTGEGIRWLKQAADAGNQFARYRLGKIYLMGEAAPKDVDAAIAYLTASAGQGNQYAQYTLGKLYLLGREVERDRDTAMRWLSLSAAQGNTYAQYFIDHMDDFRGTPAASAVLRMLHHMGSIFRDNSTADGIHVGMQIDKKLRRKMKQKKIAMGHKADDHEQEQKYIMKQ